MAALGPSPAMGASPGAGIVDPEAALSREVAMLQELDLHELRSRWRQRLRGPPPASLSRPLLLRLLAYRLQAKVLGDLDPDSARLLDRLARDHAGRRNAAQKRKPKAVPVVPPVPPVRGLKPGTLLMREHAGTMQRVTVLGDGFAWNGTRYGSLSEIARAITGTRWNGPRFFGLGKGGTVRNVEAAR